MAASVPRLSLETRKAADPKAGSPMSQSSLAISTFSTPEVVPRELRDQLPGAKDGGSASSAASAGAATASALGAAAERYRERNANSMVMAKLDVTDFFAPLEARLSAQVQEVEAKLDRRLSALERQLQGSSGSSGNACATGETEATIDSLRETFKAQLQRFETTLGAMGQQVKTCQEGQASMQDCLAELRLQVRHDRQESFEKFEGFSDALESRLRKLYDNVEAALCTSSIEGSPMEGSPMESGTGGTGIARWRSTPNPTLLLNKGNRSPSPAPGCGTDAKQSQLPSHSEMGEECASTDVPIQRWCSVPAATLAMAPRGDRSPQVPCNRATSPESATGPGAGAGAASAQRLGGAQQHHQHTTPQQPHRSLGPPGGASGARSPPSQQRTSATGHLSPSLGVLRGGAGAGGGAASVPPWAAGAGGAQAMSRGSAGGGGAMSSGALNFQRMQQQANLRSSGSAHALQHHR